MQQNIDEKEREREREREREPRFIYSKTKNRNNSRLWFYVIKSCERFKIQLAIKLVEPYSVGGGNCISSSTGSVGG